MVGLINRIIYQIEENSYLCDELDYLSSCPDAEIQLGGTWKIIDHRDG
jgi:hypothetical protein